MDRLTILRTTIDRADQMYYVTGNSPFTDNQYDALKRELKAASPEDERLSRVGPPFPVRNKVLEVKHSRLIGSLNNAMDVDQFKAWATPLTKAAEGFWCSLKVDGLTLELTY